MEAEHAVQAAGPREVLGLLQTDFARLYGIAPELVDPGATFIALGADSLFLLRASQAIQDRFGVKVPFRQLMEELGTLGTLASHIAGRVSGGNGGRHAPAVAPVTVPPLPRLAAVPAPVLAPAPPGNVGSGTLERLLSLQLDVMNRQLELLRGARPAAAGAAAAAPVVRPPAPSAPPASPVPSVFPAAGTPPAAPAADFDPRQRQYLDDFIQRYCRRTPESKRLAQAYRFPLADNRASARFRSLWKEICYQIVIDHGHGSHIRDVDGNEYVDLAMGFGALLYGHSPDFMLQAVDQEIDHGLQVGPQTRMAGEAAELIRALTGVERVSFVNSGTEAVMSALRLARAVTGRERIAMCAGSYHGTFDGVLVQPSDQRPGPFCPAMPQAPGIPLQAAADVLVLEQGSEASLAALRRHGHELAAVIVEPRQSRRPGLDATGFLRELRVITREIGAALIFDEVIVGFRCHPGGAQALFGVEADLVTYGKAVGAGLPIGVVAGKAAYMDVIDGGPWSFGDASYPATETTILRGTFFKHPWVMAAAVASLRHLQAHSPGLQQDLTARTGRLVAALNGLFEREGVAIRVSQFSSLFYFDFSPEMRAYAADLFFYHLVERGVYVWEGRTCYLSTAHTDRDLDFVLDAVAQVVAAMKRGGFLATAGGNGKEALEILPLSNGQRELWILARLDEQANRAYEVRFTLEAFGPVDPATLQRALQTVVDRHGALRASFAPDGGGQRVQPAVRVDLGWEDLSGLSPDEHLTRRQEALEGQAPIDLERAPLLRALLLRYRPDHHLLILRLPHIVVEGWSVGVVLRELCAVYDAVRRGEEPGLPPALDYAACLSEQIAREPRPGGPAEAFWLDRLAGVPAALELPTDRPRPRQQSYDGALFGVTLGDPELLEALRAIGRRRGCTLFTVMLAAFSTLLHRLTGQPDLVLGTALAGQSLAGWRELVGYFLLTFPVRSRLLGAPDFPRHLEAVRTFLLEAFEHAGYPMGPLVHRLGLPLDPSRPALVPVSFNLDFARPRFALDGAEARFELESSGFAKFELGLDCTETETGFLMTWEYRSCLFDATTVRRWAASLNALLAALARNDGLPVSELPLLAAGELHQVLHEWNDREAPTEGRPFHHVVADLAAAAPQATALVQGERRWTYGELRGFVVRLARLLRRRGVGRDEVVGICLDRSPEMVAAVLAVLEAGAAYLPLDPDYPRGRLAFMLEDARPRWVLTRMPAAGALPEVAGVQQIRLDLEASDLGAPEAGAATEDSAPPPDEWVAPGQLAYVIYTSGSTGRPKGTLVSHRGLSNLVTAQHASYGLGPHDRVLLFSSLSFDASISEIALALGAGAALHLGTDTLAGPVLAEALRGGGITAVTLTPSVLASLPPVELPDLAVLICAGEALPAELAARWAQGRRLYNAYGPTEATVWASLDRLPPGAARPTLGWPIANVELHVLDALGGPLPPGVAGELCIASPGLARGYLGRPELTARRFVPHPWPERPGERLYRTGDLARRLPDGRIDFLGRIDQQVKLRGFRIELGEVESVLAEQPGVAACAVTLREDEPGEPRIVAYVVTGGSAAAGEELRAALRRHLPRHMIPAEIVELDALPLGPTGKTDRAALPAPGLPRQAAAGFAAAESEAERILLALWQEVLGHSRAGALDNFFDLGAHSLQLVNVHSRLPESWRRRTRLVDLFNHPTVRSLARFLTSGEPRPERP